MVMCGICLKNNLLPHDVEFEDPDGKYPFLNLISTLVKLIFNQGTMIENGEVPDFDDCLGAMSSINVCLVHNSSRNYQFDVHDQ